MAEFIKTYVADRVAYLVLNRPEKRNALSAEMIEEMTNAMLTINADESVKVIVINSADKPFCAGADMAYLTQLRTFTLSENEADSQRLRALFDLIYLSPKFVISQVEGPALAGGCGLAILADICVATPSATFGYTEVKIGFIPALVMVYLREKLSGTVISDLLLTGRILTADESLKLQLIQRVVAENEIVGYVKNLANQICESTSAQAVSTVKSMLRNLSGMNRTEALDYAAKQNAIARGSVDCIKGMDAFLSKEKLKW